MPQRSSTSTPKRKETRKTPVATQRKPRSEDRSEAEEKTGKAPKPKKGNSVKRNRNRDDPSEHETTEDEMNIQEKQNHKNRMCE